MFNPNAYRPLPHIQYYPYAVPSSVTYVERPVTRWEFENLKEQVEELMKDYHERIQSDLNMPAVEQEESVHELLQRLQRKLETKA